MDADRAEHVILTRFNVPLQAESQLGISEAWLAPRVQLFTDICAPSVTGQRDATPRWLIFLDARTPRRWLEQVELATSGLPTTLVLVDGPLPDAQVRAELVAAVRPTRPYLVTSRLDNDDALAAGYCAAVLDAAREGGREMLNPTRGLQLRDGRVYAAHDRSSPFLSMVEPLEAGRLPHTVMSVPHHYAGRAYPLRQLRTPPLWLQAVHGANVVNDVTGRRIGTAALAEEFPHLRSPASATPESRLALGRDRVTTALGAAAHRASRRVREVLPMRAPHDWRPVGHDVQ